ncbi:MAG TPA: ribonuclease P protein component [Acidimicrobiia bacterium]|nr:ribonuclease P protein component [Acidimicrobiia bacterium]
MPDFESLRSPRDFRRVLKEGTRRRSGGVVMVQCSGVPGVSRVGLVVSKSTGNAVTRNRIKRRLRHTLGAVQLRPGIDYVLIGSSQVAEVPHSELMGWLERALDDDRFGDV